MSVKGYMGEKAKENHINIPDETDIKHKRFGN